MNFSDDPSDFFLKKNPKLKERFNNSVYRELSNTCAFTSITTAGLWRMFGDHIPFNDSLKMFERLVESGINHYDLGNNYGRPPGSAEKKFGKVIKKYSDLRDELIISSKAGYEMLPGPNGSGSSLKHLRSSIESSIKRIGIDYLDIFYTHRYDPFCDCEVVADNLHYLYNQGLFLYVGISSYPKQELFKLIEFLNARKVPIACLQYNVSILSLSNYYLCKECYEEWGISTIAFSPLNQGILTDSYYNNSKENSSRLYEEKTTVHSNGKKILEGLEEIKKISNNVNLSIEDLSIAFLLSNKFICSVAYGPRTIEQILSMKVIKENIGKLENAYDFERLIKYSVLSLDQWKTRNIRNKYEII
tara:strand:+ start:270 stop:1349 length:1080 start_codon:yes stop_codon:yes gene_type:complete